MASGPDVTFIICTYNRAKYLDDTLQSLLHSVKPGQDIEILVIDNNSQDETRNVVQKYKKSNENNFIRYVKEKKQGLSHARNRGIKEASASYVVFLDDDIRATASLIPTWIEFFDKYPDVSAAGGKIHVQFDDPRPEWMSHFLLPLLGYHDLGDTAKTYPANKFPFGGNMGFKKSVFNDVGFFNTDLGRKGASLEAQEEKELFRRIRVQDEKIFYLPDAFLYHRVNQKRLNTDYIRKQALGLGKSMKLQLNDATATQKGVKLMSEAGKWIATVPLAFGYLLTGKSTKAKMLFRFRQWIWEGYRNQ